MPLNFARPSSHDPNRWFLDFDLAAPGGRGGGSILLDPARQFVSIDSIHRNRWAPRHATGGFVAAALVQIGMPRPAILESYNVERVTAAALNAGINEGATPMGGLLDRIATALGGAVVRWESIQVGSGFHLWAHLEYA